MDPRNCGFCSECGAARYSNCTTFPRAPAGGSEPIAWAIPQTGQFSWDKQDERWWTPLVPASAPASAPLPLTAERIADIWHATGYLESNHMKALWAFADAIIRECLAAAPVADERAKANSGAPICLVAYGRDNRDVLFGTSADLGYVVEAA